MSTAYDSENTKDPRLATCQSALAADDVPGLHYDEGKPQVDGISPTALLALGEILEAGAKKYKRFNWVKGIDYSRIYASALRHLLKWYNGKERDEESAKPALAHALCDVMFLLHYTLTPGYEAFDDRPFKRDSDVRGA